MAAEPDRTERDDCDAALSALIAREPLFHRPEFGTSRADFANMVTDDFRETGASGRRYDRDFILDTLEARHAAPHDDPWDTRDFRCRALGGDTWLLTYTLHQRERVTRRMTLWQYVGQDWRAIYHQGTVVSDPAQD